MPKYHFKFEMACGGCSNAAKKNLSKIGVEDVEVDMDGQKLLITTEKSADDCLEALKKTGKKVEYIGEVTS